MTSNVVHWIDMDNFEIDFDYLRTHIRWLGERLREAIASEDWATATRTLDELEAMHENLTWIAQNDSNKHT